MPLFVVVLLKRTIYNKKAKREAVNERRKNERSQNGHKKDAHGRFCNRPEIWLSFTLILINFSRSLIMMFVFSLSNFGIP